MSTNFCKICGGKTGFTNTESRRHEATKRHIDAVADLALAKQDAPKVQRGRKAVAAGISGILAGTATAESVLSDPDVAAAISPETPDIDLGPVVDESGAPTDQTLAVLTDAAPAPVLSVAELKAIRMRQKWAAERAERRSQKDPANAELAAKAEAEWAKEHEAYAVYRAALDAAKNAGKVAQG